MHTWSCVVLTGAFLSLLAGASLAQNGAADRPPQSAIDKAAILRELDKLEQLSQDQAAADLKSFGDSLSKALATKKALLELYEEAVFATRFEGAKKDNTEFKKWKNAQDDLLKSDDFQAALDIHAQYLHLTYLHANGEKEAKLNEALAQHVLKVWAAESKCDLRRRGCAELLDRPINQGLLARHFHLGTRLGGPQDGEKPREQDKTWEWFPANADGMLDRTLLPYLRKIKSPALIALWDKRIANEAVRAKQTALSEKASQITQQTLPRLNWQRAADLALMGREAEGYSAMISILRQNPKHPDFGKFVQELRRMITGEAAPPAESSGADGSN